MWKRWLRGIAVFVLILGLWELTFRAGVLNPIIFGSPSLIVKAAATDAPTFVSAFAVTAYEIAIATMIAWVFGVVFGLLFGSLPISNQIFAPVLSAVIAVPLVVLYPVLVAWLGIGPPSKYVYGAAAGFFPIALATLLGIRAIDRQYVRMAVAMGANRRQVLTQVLSRLALPAIVSGLRIGTSLTIISVVQSEMLSSTDGLGFWISYHRSLFMVGHVYFGIILVLVLAAVANFALSLLERHFGRWRALQQAAL
jgi:NitT/TauT family transport system permease protein